MSVLVLDQSLRVAARLWYARLLQAAPTTPSPRNSPLVRVGEGPGDRVLLIGNGVLHGWGVHLRELSVPGHLAQQLHERTGRPVVVEYVGEERMNAASAPDWLGSAAGRGHDVAVIGLGMNDALRLTPVAEWREQVVRLVGRVRREQDPSARVVLVELPRVRRFAMADSAMGAIAQRHAEKLNAVLQEVAAGDARVRLVPAPEERFEAARPLGSSAMYQDWAEQLVPPVLAELEAARAVKRPAPEPHEAWEWAGTPVALEADGSSAQQRLDALTEEVRERFGVAMAGINVVDGETVHSVAGRGGGPRAMPRSLAYCDVTVQRDAPTVIEDADRDARFAGNPFLDVVGLPFYAGVPLHALDGRAVATLCVLDDVPRDDVDLDELQRFAGRAEAELQRFERAGGAAADDGADSSRVAAAP